MPRSKALSRKRLPWEGVHKGCTVKSRSRVTTEAVTRPLPFAWYWPFTHAWVLAKRRLTQMLRTPDELICATLQPITWSLLFR